MPQAQGLKDSVMLFRKVFFISLLFISFFKWATGQSFDNACTVILEQAVEVNNYLSESASIIPLGSEIEFVGQLPDATAWIVRNSGEYYTYPATSPDIHPAGCEPSSWGTPPRGYLRLESVMDEVGITAWHEQGYFGQGVRVGILDTRYDDLSATLTGLPISESQVTFIPSPTDLETLLPQAERTEKYHGTKVLEVMAYVAPEADYVLARSVDATSFSQAVDDLIAEDVQIIIHAGNVITPDPKPYHQAVQRATEDHDIFWVNSAGNMGVGYYPGLYSGGEGLLPVHQFADPNRAGTQQSLMVPVDRSQDVTVTAIWDPGPDDAYEFELFVSGNCRLDSTDTFPLVTSQQTEDTPAGMARVTISTGQLAQIGDYNTVPSSGKQFACTNTANSDGLADHHIFISLRDANQDIPVDTRFDLYVQGAIPATFDPFTMVSLDPVVQSPADILQSFTVGAQTTNTATTAWYSGRSNSLQYYELNDFNVDYSTDELVRPNIMTYGEIELPSGRKFFGTSAATPIVGGVAALLYEQNNGIEVDQLVNTGSCLFDGAVSRQLRFLKIKQATSNQSCETYYWEVDLSSSLISNFSPPETLKPISQLEGIRRANLALATQEDGNPSLALALALAANEIPNPPVEARDALQQIAFKPGIRDWLVAPEGAQYSNLEFIPDGSYLFAAYTRRIGNWIGIVDMWDIGKKQIIHSFQTEIEYITDIGISYDGNFLAVAGCSRNPASYCRQGRIEVWDINTYDLYRIFEHSKKEINAIDFAKDSLLLASVGCHEIIELEFGSMCTENEIILVDLMGEYRVTATLPSSTLSDIAIHPDGGTLVTGGSKCVEDQTICEEGEIIIWDSKTLKQLNHITPMYPPLETPDSGVEDVKYDHSGNYIVSRTFSTVAIWNSQNGELIESEWRLSFMGSDMSLYGPYNSFDSLMVTSDFETVIVNDLFSDFVNLELAGHTGIVNDVVFSPDGRFIVSADDDETMILWALKPGNEIQSFDFKFELLPDANQNVIFDDHYLLTQTCDQREEGACYEINLILWDIEDQSIVMTIPSISIARQPPGEGLWITEIGFDLEAERLAIGMNDRSVSVFDTRAQKLLQTYIPNPLPRYDNEGIQRIAIYDENTIISANCENVAVGWFGCLDEIVVWDIASNSPKARIPLDFVYTLSSTGEYAVASRCLSEYPSCDSYSMMLINVVNSETLWELNRDFSRIVNVAFDITQEYIVILHERSDEDNINNGSRHQEVTILDKAGSVVAQNVTLPADTLAVRYNAQNGSIIALSSNRQNNRQIVWNISTGEKLIVLEDILDSSFLSDSGQLLTSGIRGSTIKIRRIYTYAELLDWVDKNRYTRDLTCAERNQYSIEPLCDPVVSDLRVTPFPTPGPIEVKPAEVRPFDVTYDTPINIGEVIDATLFASATDIWILNGEAGDVIDIIVSAQFDSTVELINSTGLSLAFNDDFSENPGDSRILEFRLPWSAEYTIEVSGDSEDLLGEEYSLLVTDTGTTGNTSSDFALSIGMNAIGFLQPGESHYWTFEASTDDLVDIHVIAEFDSIVTLYDEFGNQININDDYNNTNESRISNEEIQADGTYSIEVFNLALVDFIAGSYELELNFMNAISNKSGDDTYTTTANLDTNCPNLPAAQLQVGGNGIVPIRQTDSNNMRSEPATGARIVRIAPPGTVFDIVGGPECASGYRWWQVRLPSGASVGWLMVTNQRGGLILQIRYYYQFRS